MVTIRTMFRQAGAPIAVVALLILGFAGAGAALEAQEGLRGELIKNLDAVEEKLIGLAEATPAEKYGWRPAEGIRSVSENFMHVAGGNYFILRAVGVAPPDDLPKNLEGVTDKAEVIEILRGSIAHVRKAIQAMPDSELDKEVDLFGQKSSSRGVLLLISGHLHEHLGQAIAYARSTGVVPPWSQGSDG